MSALGAALVESDRRYFELGATVEVIDGAEVAWMAGMQATPAGCVVHRVQPAEIGAGAGAGPWVAEVTRRLRAGGWGLARVYLDGRDVVLERALAAAGYSPREEIGFVAEGALAAGPRSDVTLREVVDEDGWETKAKLHAGSDVAADGHVTLPEEWVDFERRKWATGGMKAFLVEVDGEVCGAVATLEGDGLLRAKNVFVHPDRRREGIAAETLRLLSRRAVGSAATGIFGVDGRPGAAVYVHLRMAPVVRQYEWSRPL
jgi:GNAT superfamily N-acetyltransferase